MDRVFGFRELVAQDMDWTNIRKRRFRKKASTIKVTALILTAASTVVLGIQAIPARASVALPMVAAVTALAGIETYYSWRSRWILMEETQYRLHRLLDEMDYYLINTPPDELEPARFDAFFEQRQAIWSDVSGRWLEFRRLAQAGRTQSVSLRRDPSSGEETEGL